MDQTQILWWTASVGVCTGLFWLAAELAEAARVRAYAGSLNHLLRAVPIALTAGALWWPLQMLQPAASALMGGASGWLALTPALALAALALSLSEFSGRAQWWRSLGVALAMPVCAGAQVFWAMSGGVVPPGSPRWWDWAGLSLALSLPLIGASLRLGEVAHAKALRLAAAALAGAASCAIAYQGAPLATISAGAFGSAGWLAAMLVAMCAVLLSVLRHTEAVPPQVQPRTPRHAMADSLTGLPTRLYFEGQLHSAAKQCEQHASRMAVLFIDLDGFKPVNDTFGHSSGDHVLAQVGKRLKALARQSGVAARIGGDEFLLLVMGVRSLDAVAQLARRLTETLSQPYLIDEREVAISCSVGIAMYPEKCHPNKLIARADAAMYAAKRAGGARHCFYAPSMDVDVQQNFDMLRDLRKAVANGELELYFQPKIDANSGKVTAAEALLRWNHPTRGLVLPEEFIPLAERSGMIGVVGDWVIEAACKQARAWRDKGLRMRVAINLSAHQMRQEDIAERIADALRRHRIHASLLTCEITETAAMEDTGATQETFRRLGELGAHLSIDDFGTGYSSLSYLRRLPAEELKIDASFVRDLDHSGDARAVVNAVVKLAHALGLKVVAEGVENARQQKILIEMGCDELQGYLFARPMTARALLLWAIDDRSTSAVFRNSLFGETHQASRQGLRPGLRHAG